MQQGRKRDSKQYDLYKIVDGKEIYQGRFVRDMIRDQYNINTKNLKRDIENYKKFRGNDGLYRIYNAGKFKPARQETKEPEKKAFSVPLHVKKVRCSSGCRFKG